MLVYLNCDVKFACSPRLHDPQTAAFVHMDFLNTGNDRAIETHMNATPPYLFLMSHLSSVTNNNGHYN